MKKVFVLTAIFLALSVASFAQKNVEVPAAVKSKGTSGRLNRI